MTLDTNNSGLSDALVILGAAGLVIPAFARFRISPVIGFILVGLLVGPSGLGAWVDQYPWLYYVTITNQEAIAPFAEMGIVLLLFTIGLELSFKRLWNMRKLVFGVGAAELGACAIIIAGGLMLMGNSLAAALGLGLALALSSTALVLPIAGTEGPVGKTAFSMLLFEDLALVPIIFLLGALAPASQGSGLDSMVDTLWKGGLTVVAMLIAGRYLLPQVFFQAARIKSPEVFLAASLLVVITSSLLTALSGLSPIVGALIAGLLIAETDYNGEVEVVIEPFKGLALGVFLITVGMSLDMEIILGNWASLALAVLAVVLVKTIVTALLLRLAGASKGVAAEVGLLMASPSETTLIVLATAASVHIINPQAAAFWQIATAIGLTITPLLARVGHDVARYIEARNIRPETEDENSDIGARAVIIGFGRVGRMVSDLLRTHDQPFIAIDANPDTVNEARRNGYPVRYGDVSRGEMLERLQLGRARALILTMDDPVLCITLTRRIRARIPGLTIIARARDAAHAAELYKAGASEVVPETLESSLQLAETALVDLGVAMGPVLASIHQKREDLRQAIKGIANLEEAPRLRHFRVSDAEQA